MDASTFRWVLIIIAVVLAVAIYLYGLHQTRLRKRNAVETFTREEVDSTFVEDEQLRFEMNNLNKILTENETDENLEEFVINPAEDAGSTPSELPDPEIFILPELADKDQDRLISHYLRHDDFRLIVGEEAESAVQKVDLQLSPDGLLEYREEEELAFQIASLSKPGNFHEIGDLNFSTLGFNCFIDLDSCANPRLAYEAMLKKIDELVRILNVTVYKTDHELLTISDVTDIREKLV